jgi:O-antigen ligase
MIAGKGSLMAPLFFLSLAFAAAGSMIGTVAPWAMSAAVLSFLALRHELTAPSTPWIGIALLAYGLLVTLNTLFMSPAYTPAGLYHPLLLVLAYFGIRKLTDRPARHAALATLLFGAILAAWGLVQIGATGVARAHAIFETPATYATVLNLLLLPLLAGLLVLRRDWWLPATAVLLAAGLIAADSRGGFLAMLAGLGAALILGVRGNMLQRRGLLIVPVVLASAWLLVFALRGLTAPGVVEPTPEARAESSISRLELYSLSLNAWREQPLAGTGYLTFRYALESGRAQVPSYGTTSETWFVHNDYLQTLQELGPLGLLALLGLATLPPLLAYRKLPYLPVAQRPIVVSATAGLVAMAVHALVDFPFYIPLCLLIYGALLGVIDARLVETPAMPREDRPPARWARVARAAVLTVAAIVLLRPVAAEAAGEWGLRKLAAGEGQRAAFWLGAAQRLDPRDWRYHWYAGQFWDAQAAESGKPEAAQLAADAYSAGFAANPLEVKNLLGKISVHRRHRQLLREPADPSTLQQWLAHANALAPLNPAVQRELAR